MYMFCSIVYLLFIYSFSTINKIKNINFIFFTFNFFIFKFYFFWVEFFRTICFDIPKLFTTLGFYFVIINVFIYDFMHTIHPFCVQAFLNRDIVNASFVVAIMINIDSL